MRRETRTSSLLETRYSELPPLATQLPYLSDGLLILFVVWENKARKEFSRLQIVLDICYTRPINELSNNKDTQRREARINFYHLLKKPAIRVG